MTCSEDQCYKDSSSPNVIYGIGVQRPYVDSGYQFLSAGDDRLVIGAKISFSREPTVDSAGSKSCTGPITNHGRIPQTVHA